MTQKINEAQFKSEAERIDELIKKICLLFGQRNEILGDEYRIVSVGTCKMEPQLTYRSKIIV